MKDKINKLFNSASGLLTFALISGAGYFFMVLRIVMEFSRNKSGLIGYFFAPAIICGSALFIVKTVKQNIEMEQADKNLKIFFIHTVVILLGIVFLADIIIN